MGNPSPNGHSQSLAAWAAEAAAATEIARQMVPTEFVPDTLRVWTDKDAGELDFPATVQVVAMVLLAGQELGFGPMGSLRAITIIRGTVGLYAIAARAILLRDGHEIEIRESTSVRAIVDGRRRGSEKWQRSTWTIDRATVAGLYPGKMGGNWRTQPQSMLVARATAEACRWVDPDGLLGVPLMVEEIEDREVGEVLAIASAATEPGPEAGAAAAEPEGKRQAKRRRTPGPGGLPDGPRRAEPDPVPPMPGAGEEPKPPAPPEEPRLTRTQRKQIVEGLQAIGKGDTPEDALGFVNTAIAPTTGREVENTGQLSQAEAVTVLQAIEALRKLTGAEPAAPAADAEPPADAEPGEQAEPGTLPGMPEAPPPEAPREPE